jgi:xanthine dehydrogenase accessory factor
MMRADLTRRADALAAAREPFVTAMVVRAQRPASVRPGDGALVLRDGTIEGFVGGACAEPAVRLHASRVLETGEPVLLRIVPGDDDAPAQEGAVTVQNHCLSGGALEIFLEPRLPAPRVLALGDSPIALALASIGERVGLDVVPVSAGGEVEPGDDDIAVVVASHGHGEPEALERALRSAVPYVGLVASPRRGAAVVEELRAAGVTDEQLARLHTPAGLEIGARSPEEIALSILAQIVAVRRREGAFPEGDVLSV